MLSRLMRTSRVMHVRCVPLLYQHLEIFYTPSQPNLFASPDSTMAFSNNVQHVRELQIDLLGLVYLLNGVVAFNNLTDPSTKRSPSRPQWLVLPDPRSCLVMPIPPITLLTKLTIHISHSANLRICPYYLQSVTNPSATLTQVCWMLALTSCLRELDLTGLIFKDFWDVRLFTNAVSELEGLQKLALVATFWERTPIQLGRDVFFCCPSSLVDLQMTFLQKDVSQDRFLLEEYRMVEPGGFHSWESEENDDLPEVPQRRKRLANLRRLFVHQTGPMFSEDDFRSITRQCPNVLVLKVPALGKVKNVTRLAKDVATSCKKVKVLWHRGFSEGGTGGELVFRMMSVLRAHQVAEFTCCAKPFEIEGLDVRFIFRRHSQALKYVSLTGCRNVRGKVIQVLLADCSALEVLDTAWMSENQEACIDLEEAIEFQWTCTRMRALRLTIGIPVEPLHQPHDNAPYYNRPPPITFSVAEEQQLEQLEQLYKRIGTLTLLETLRLEVIFFDANSDHLASADNGRDSFPAMLTAGDKRTGRPGFLRHLAGLTKLKSLLGSVSATTDETEVTMGWEEALWMNENWPELEKAGFFLPQDRIRDPFRWLIQQRLTHRKLCLSATV
ncbi:hypothetical protein BG015_009176 [Linnemannia schmuckeri]|uniref:Uncharacterized protein n=1 Tax=Linnemannia schmuckeri TaxID=64567 RepID=A0A9P5S5F5_9FUNG|nr:hypothetical protein BG015_009176 [Linnemannia schmuckeri]